MQPAKKQEKHHNSAAAAIKRSKSGNFISSEAPLYATAAVGYLKSADSKEEEEEEDEA